MPITALAILAGKPYHGFDAECLATPAGNPPRLELDCVRLTHSDGGREQYVGLDQTDFILPPPKPTHNPRQRFMRGEVWVYGELTVQNIQWLSEKGQRLLESKVRKRDDEGTIAGSTPSRVTLTQLYGWLDKGNYTKRPRIVLRFRRQMQARWANIAGIDRIVMESSEMNRTFIIRGMESECYGQSMNWLHREQMFRLMKRLIQDAHPQQPIEGRTARWFMDQYRAQILPMDRRRRIIPGEHEGSQSIVSLEATVVEERFLRHLSAAELISSFAEQCEGLLANQIASTSDHVQLFNVKDWAAFCRLAHRNRLDAWNQGVRWGLPPGVNSPHELIKDDDGVFGLERFGGVKEDWKKKLEEALKRQSKRKERRAPTPSPPLVFSPPTSKKRKRNEVKPDAIFDPDFSEPSTEGESDSDDDQSDPPAPSYLSLQTPRVPQGHRRWHCPHSGCHFSISKLELFQSRKFDPVKYAANVGVQDEFRRAMEAAVVNHELDAHLPGIIQGEVYHRRREPSRYRRSGRLDGKRARVRG